MKFRWTAIATGVVLLALIVWAWASRSQSAATDDRLLLLVPDGTSFADPRVTVWLDAGSEEGLHVTAIHDSEFTRPFFGHVACAGLILPDSIHRQASDYMVAAIRQFVAAGGKLMLVYDAGTLSADGRYAWGESRLSDLAGVDYALYDQLHDHVIVWGNVSTSSDTVRLMNIPPGKYYPFENDSTGSGSDNFEVQLTRYLYGDLRYPSFVTSGNYDGHVIFHSPSGVVAGEHAYQKGSVLFVNLPLGYLKANTDGLLLHAFLKYFAEHFLSLPYLMSVPDGVGGVVLNWHIDSNAAIKPLEAMGAWPLVHQGPFSIHVTAGPDDKAFGDHQGFDIEHNPISQELIRKYGSLGNQIGSHGGWIHDYFAAHVDKDDPNDMQKFLAWNKSSLEKLTGKPVVEYSAPEGNQPVWVTHWLESHGFLAYYFTGNSGMGPTQGYRNGVREGQTIWAFPIVHLNKAAAFEEMVTDGYSSPQIERWLEAVTEFTVEHRTVRLVYFHPPGILRYRGIIGKWMEQTARLQASGEFRWYTMSSLAGFLNSRKQVAWKISDTGGQITVNASHPQDLEHQTWRLPAGRFSEPVIVAGSGRVIRDNDAWMVVAGQGKNLQFETKMVSE